MANATCVIDGCERRIVAWGWCDKHYRRWKNNGDPLKVRRIHGDDVLRFESRVDRSGGPDACHPWTGKPTPDGYGMIQFGGKGRLVHAVAWESAHGCPVPPGMEVDHECHNRAVAAGTCRRGKCAHRLCCNERHLAAKTHLENVRAAGPLERPYLRGRRPSWAKLTESQVAEIRILLSDNVPCSEIAVRYGVSRPTVSMIKSGKTWAQPAALYDADQLPGGSPLHFACLSDGTGRSPGGDGEPGGGRNTALVQPRSTAGVRCYA